MLKYSKTLLQLCKNVTPVSAENALCRLIRHCPRHIEAQFIKALALTASASHRHHNFLSAYTPFHRQRGLGVICLEMTKIPRGPWGELGRSVHVFDAFLHDDDDEALVLG